MNKYMLCAGVAAVFMITGCNRQEGIVKKSDQTASAESGAVESFPTLSEEEISRLKHVKQTLVAPPQVPEHSLDAPAEPSVIEVELEAREQEIEVEPGVFMWASTFNGSIPGPMIIVHEGDYVMLTLNNPKTNKMAHNINFHAATGGSGGGDMTTVKPGESVTLRWRAIKPGVFVYQSTVGGAGQSMHGMNGVLVVLPREGLKDKNNRKLVYDKAFYIGGQDFYLPKNDGGAYRRYPDAEVSMQDDGRSMNERVPTHIVFGAKKGAYTGTDALQAKVGETVMIYHSQVGLPSYPHLNGGHGEYVWERGNLADKPQQNLGSWVIGAGSAGAVMYTFKQPGVYLYQNYHRIGPESDAVAQIKVEGIWNAGLMKQIHKSVPAPDAASAASR